ncbi:unnamed protein product [Echinostoma caproni]|uniref:Ig-like domain-containing protein n=1 Tax=Echinostoma caproni TaxID=27848 RepID=A0A183AMG6_9TREM|nr:unnamed protein product [Echinostoma caproni]
MKLNRVFFRFSLLLLLPPPPPPPLPPPPPPPLNHPPNHPLLKRLFDNQATFGVVSEGKTIRINWEIPDEKYYEYDVLVIPSISNSLIEEPNHGFLIPAPIGQKIITTTTCGWFETELVYQTYSLFRHAVHVLPQDFKLNASAESFDGGKMLRLQLIPNDPCLEPYYHIEFRKEKDILLERIVMGPEVTVQNPSLCRPCELRVTTPDDSEKNRIPLARITVWYGQNFQLILKTKAIKNGAELDLHIAQKYPCFEPKYRIELRIQRRKIMDKNVTGPSVTIKDTVICKPCDLYVTILTGPKDKPIPTHKKKVWFGTAMFNVIGSTGRIDVNWDIPSAEYANYEVVVVRSGESGNTIPMVPDEKNNLELVVTEPVGGGSFVKVNCGLYDVKLNNGMDTVTSKTVAVGSINNKILVRTSVVDNGRVLSVDLSANDPCLGSAFVITLKKGEKIVLEKPITSRTERIANDTLVCASCNLIVSLPDNIRLPVESSDPVVVWFGETVSMAYLTVFM